MTKADADKLLERVQTPKEAADIAKQIVDHMRKHAPLQGLSGKQYEDCLIEASWFCERIHLSLGWCEDAQAPFRARLEVVINAACGIGMEVEDFTKIFDAVLNKAESEA